ncbi:MAG: TonB-dependent receptor [Prevotella sp.]|jgi:iron complex outermembrane receptor protein|nr:TonB-dependent receptor [Prevotella sp.]
MKINRIKTKHVSIKIGRLFILACFIFASVSIGAQNQTINLPTGNLTIKKIFQEIEKQTNLSIDYNQTRLNTSQRVTIQTKENTLSSLLTEVLNESGFEYTIENDHIIIKQENERSERPERAQRTSPKKITGKITDEAGEPLIGANVQVKGTTHGTLTDEDGNYELDVPQSATLQISYIGYLNQDINTGNKTVLNIKLSEDAHNLDEVVVVGYGTMTRREITGSVTNITTKDFNKGFSKDAAGLLQGKVAGLEINNGSGDVTSNASIRLRGVSTLQNDQGPFIVIDNVPGADLSTVAPQDIESISILKDASSAAIYGSRSAGGVILITTKRGTANQPRISYAGSVGISTLANKPKLMKAGKWRQYTAENYGEDAKSFDLGANTDWFDEITRTGFQQEHNVSLSGGGTGHTYRGSVSYMQRDGLARDNTMKRYNVRLQFTQWALNNKLKIDLTGVTTLTDNAPTNGRNFVLAYNMIPVRLVRLENGDWFDTREYDQGNPVRNQDENTYMNKINNFYGTGNLTFSPIEGLDLKAMFSKIRNNEDYSEYRSIGSEAGYSDGGYGQRTGRITDKELTEWTANYSTQIQKHKINALVGYSWEQEDYSAHTAERRGFITDLLGANDLASGQNARNSDVGSEKNRNRLISFYGRLNYSFDEKYLLTATIRRDGSTKFGKNNKWGTFPSVSAAWNISQEEFMKGARWLNDLKLRVGYGVTGNQSGLDPYKTLELYGSGERYYDNGSWLSAYKIHQNANPDLKWEQTAMLNIGVDFSMFSNRLSARVEWYDKKTSDMLYSYPVPTPPYLYPEIMANVGDMSNKGIEVTINYNAVRTKDFDWDISLNMAHNKNKVTKLSNDFYTADYVLVGGAFIRGGSSTTHILEVGRPVGQFYGLVCNGLDENGKYIFVDQNDDGEISDPADLDYIGSAQPKLTYGLTNTFRYKNFDLSIFVRGSIGNKILNMPRMAYAQSGFLPGTNALDDPLTYELKETTPRYSSFYLENGSYLRLDNMSLGYKINKWHGMRVYVTAQNLFVITKYKGLDPEVPITDNDGLSPGIEQREFYPKARTFSIGLNLNF